MSQSDVAGGASAQVSGDLINGVYRLLGALPDGPRRGMHLAHSLVTGELVTLAVPGKLGERPSRGELRTEGDLFGPIAHPNVHRIVDWSSDETFVAWEYVSAWALSDAIDAKRPIALGATLRLMRDIAAGLGAVHSQGIVYRGLHPGRVFVARDGRARLATCSEALNTGRGRVVEVGPPEETPIRYLPPEQIEGGIDGRSDLYTLAAIAYEALTARRLYANADPVTLAVQILKTTPEPPSRVREDIPREVDDFFMHCLSRAPHDRPTSATAFLVHVNRLLEWLGHRDEPVVPMATTSPVAFPIQRGQVTMPTMPTPPAAGFGALASGNGHHLAEELEESAVAAPAEGHNGHAETPADVVAEDSVVVWPAAPADEHALNGAAARANGHGSTAEGEAAAAAAPPDDAPGPIPMPALEGAVDAASLVMTSLSLVIPDGSKWEVAGDKVLVGRGDSVNGSGLDLAPFDVGRVVSREHALLEQTPTGWVCRDLGATNGTYINDRRLPARASASVAPGDRLRFANVELAVEEQA